MLWLFQLFFGMFLGFYAISPRLRGFTNRCIIGTLRLVKPSVVAKRPRIKVVYMLDEVNGVKPKELDGALVTEPITLGARKGIEVGEDSVEEWMTNNPDLRELNKVKVGRT